MPYICTRNRETTVHRKKQIEREISSAGSEHLPYKQGVGGSNPSSPTNKKPRKICEAFCFYRNLLFMFYTYILYSKSTDTFYKGSTQDISERLRRHNGRFEKATKLGADQYINLWTRKIIRHISGLI